MVMGDYLCGWGRMSWYDGNGNAKGDDWGLGGATRVEDERLVCFVARFWMNGMAAGVS